MPERSRKRPRDVNELARQIVDETTGEAKPTPEPAKDPAALELGRRGGLKRGWQGQGQEAQRQAAVRDRQILVDTTLGLCHHGSPQGAEQGGWLVVKEPPPSAFPGAGVSSASAGGHQERMVRKPLSVA